MKRLIFTAITTLAVMSMTTSCSDRQTDIEEYNLKGNVEYVCDTIWDAVEKFGEIQKNYITNITKTAFNEDGQITSITTYNDKGEITGKIVQDWESKYNLAEKYRYNTQGEIGERYVYNYDKDRIRTVIGHFTTGKDTLETKTYRYDGDLLTRIDGVKGDSTCSCDYTYLDENGSYKLIEKDYKGNTNEETRYLDSDKRTTKLILNQVEYKFKYDDNGNYASTTYLQNELIYDYTEYDDEGNWTVRTITTRINNNNEKNFAIDYRYIKYRK